MNSCPTDVRSAEATLMEFIQGHLVECRSARSLMHLFILKRLLTSLKADMLLLRAKFVVRCKLHSWAVDTLSNDRRAKTPVKKRLEDHSRQIHTNLWSRSFQRRALFCLRKHKLVITDIFAVPYAAPMTVMFGKILRNPDLPPQIDELPSI